MTPIPTSTGAGGGGGGAPVNATYLTLSSNATLSNERIFTIGRGLSGFDGGVNSNYSLSVVPSGAPDATVSSTDYILISDADDGYSTKRVTAQSIGNLGGGGSTSPGGSDTEVQFNNGGVFGGSPNLTWNDTGLYVNGYISGKSLSGDNLTVGEYIYHRADPDTYIQFEDDALHIIAGNRQMIKMEEASQDKIVFNNGGLDVDFHVKGDSEPNLIRTIASSARIGVGTSSPEAMLHVTGDIFGGGGILVSGDVNISGDIYSSGLSIGDVDGDNILAVFTGADGRYRIAMGEIPDEELVNARHFIHISGGDVLIDATGGSPNNLRISGDVISSGILPTQSGAGYVGESIKPFNEGYFNNLYASQGLSVEGGGILVSGDVNVSGDIYSSGLSIGDVDGDNILAVFTGADGRYRIAMGEIPDEELVNARHFIHISGGDVLIDATGGSPNNLRISGDVISSGILPTQSGAGYVGESIKPFNEGYFNNLYTSQPDGTFENISPSNWTEAFEEDGNGDLMPVIGYNINDNMWFLNGENKLSLKSNHFRYNFGPESFTEDVSF